LKQEYHCSNEMPPYTKCVRSFDTDPSTGNDDDGFLLLGSKTGVIPGRLSCLYSNWSPNSWASPTFSTATNVQSLDIVDADTESLSTMGHYPSFNNSNSISYTSDSNTPLSLEGTLSFRKSRSSRGSSAWKPVYVVLNLMDGGSLTCFLESHNTPKGIHIYLVAKSYFVNKDGELSVILDRNFLDHRSWNMSRN
jgi:hypothetical protein